MVEIWRPIQGYEGLYEVSNLGNVKSLSRNALLSKHRNNRGYLSVSLYKENVGKHYLVHRLVAQAFINNPFNLPYVNHKDENPINNVVSNLEWCSQSYNVNYGSAQERLSSKKISKKRGLKIAQYRANILVKTYDSASQIQRELGYNTTPILNCCRRGYYRGGKWVSVSQSYGFVWKFAE